jgi:starvation-inducible DNA-binding protein
MVGTDRPQETSVSTQNHHLSGAARLEAGLQLQGLLVATLDLGLLVKQAHWNVYGAGFRDLHLHLDEIADALREQADGLAERAVALGVSPDGRAGTIVASSPLEPLLEGPLMVDSATAAIAARLDAVIAVARGRLAELGDLDPVSQDLVISLLELLEQQRWMLLAEFSSSAPAHPPALG